MKTCFSEGKLMKQGWGNYGCMEYCCHVWAGAPSCRICKTVGPSLASSLEHLALVEMWPAQVFSIGITLVDVLQNWLNWFHFLFLVGGLLLVLTDCMIFLSPFLNVQGCLYQQFLSSHCQTLEFSAYRVHFFELWSKWVSVNSKL